MLWRISCGLPHDLQIYVLQSGIESLDELDVAPCSNDSLNQGGILRFRVHHVDHQPMVLDNHFPRCMTLYRRHNGVVDLFHLDDGFTPPERLF